MPDFTTASAMPLIKSSLTLQANLFHEFHPIGGVRARLAEGEVFSCANKPVLNSKVPTIAAKISCRIFMHTFYQNHLDIGTRRFVSSLIEFLREPREVSL